MDDIIDNNEVKIVTRSGQKSVVWLSLDDYNSLTESNYLLCNPVNAEMLRNAKKDLDDGKGIRKKLIRR